MVRRTLVSACLTLLVSAPSITSQEVAIPASAYALVNARIVVSPGNVIANGTVVIRDGRIVDVGAGIDAPADAVRLDLAGKTIYAGLVDAASNVGLPQIGGGFGRGGGGG